MGFLMLVIALLVTPQTSQVQDCFKYHGCTDCVVQPHCGWCALTTSCLGGSATGPTNPQQFCSDDDWNFDTCQAIRLQDGQRFSVKDPQGGFYDYFDFALIFPNQVVTIEVDNGAAISNRRLFASQKHSLPRSNQHEWEGTVRGSLLELRLSGSDGLDYTKPLFLSVLNDVSLSYSILGQMVPPDSGGQLRDCSFAVSSTTFTAGLSLAATSAISQLCTETSHSGDAFMQRLVNGASPLSEWEVVSAVTFSVYKGLLKYTTNLTMPGGYQTLALTASSPYPYQGPKVLTVWRNKHNNDVNSTNKTNNNNINDNNNSINNINRNSDNKNNNNDNNNNTATTTNGNNNDINTISSNNDNDNDNGNTKHNSNTDNTNASINTPTINDCTNPGWVVQGHSGSLDERTQFWITTVFNQYLCGSNEPDRWAWETARAIGVQDDYWAAFTPFQTSAGWRWEVASALAIDRPEVHWIWVDQGTVPSNGRTELFVILESVPIVPRDFSP